MKIKKGDTVEVISGKDKGQRGEVLKVLLKKQLVVVQGVNVHKKHQKARPSSDGTRQLAPEIAEFDAPVHISNVMLVNAKSGEPVRVGYKLTEGKKLRMARDGSEETLD